eukprot:9824525-Alexandrium_andersonii.AAC.1
MSASLVGSEMCIRDRLARLAASARPVDLATQVPLGTHVQLPALLGGLPVSYTHLTLPTICSV